jgi:FADH2 O2-dependent halogenase
VACYSARFASQVLLEALAERDVTRARLSTYEARLRAGVDIWYEFIRLYYKLMHLFSYFIEDPRYRHQIHQLLQGEVYDRSSAPVLDRMKRVIRTVEKTPGHIWQPFLTDIPV